MYKIILASFLVCTFLCAPLDTIHAATPETDVETLLLQLHAIQSYIARTHATQTVTAPTHNALRTSIREGAAWFKNAQETSGHFRYEYAPYENTYRNGDNIVRQAGGLYILGELIRRTEKDSLKLSSTIERAISYFESISRTDTRNEKDLRCIVKSTTSVRCPLGATSLALIGILGYVEHSPEKARTYQTLIDEYLTYILTVQKSNGGFTDMYTIGSKNIGTAESPFSNGEALLALVRAYAFEPRDDVKMAIDTTFTYLKAQPFDANLYLWIMAALKDMNELWPKSEYVAYAKEFTLWRLNRATYTNTSLRNYCAYAEGLASAQSIVQEHLTQSENSVIRTELNRLNQTHLSLQLGEADVHRMVFKNGVLGLHTLQDVKRARGGFLTSDMEPTQRIDFTQHCLGAYVQTLVDIDEEKL